MSDCHPGPLGEYTGGVGGGGHIGWKIMFAVPFCIGPGPIGTFPAMQITVLMCIQLNVSKNNIIYIVFIKCLMFNF